METELILQFSFNECKVTESVFVLDTTYDHAHFRQNKSLKHLVIQNSTKTNPLP
jgi:hypothetical protein